MIKYSISQIDKSLIKKPTSLSNAKEWIFLVYSQFGFESFEEIREFTLSHNDGWFNYFYWDKEVEQEFLKCILAYFPDIRKRKQVAEYYQEASLNWFPTNHKNTWKLSGEVADNARKQADALQEIKNG